MTFDHQERAQSRIVYQYRGGPKFRDWIDTLPSIAQTELELPAETLADLLDIDNRSGALLDIVGRIVGISRPPVVRQTEKAVTSFAPDDIAPQCGESGAQFSATSYSVSSSLSDEVFRVLIKARVARNVGDATIDNIVRFLKIVTDQSVIRVDDRKDMTFAVTFGDTLSTTLRFVLNNFDFIPRPQGVRFLGFIEEPALTVFGAEFAVMGDSRAQFNEVF